MKRTYLSLVAVLLPLFVVACEESGTEPDTADRGQFTAEVTGDRTASLAGEASYGTEPNFNDFLIAMGDSGNNIGFFQDDRPTATGTFSIDGEQLRATYWHDGEVFGDSSGELEITHLGETIEGSFSFTATAGNSQVEVTGSFNAVPSDG